MTYSELSVARFGPNANWHPSLADLKFDRPGVFDPVTRTDELAVMVDTHKPLLLTRQAMEIDDPRYPYSWIE